MLDQQTFERLILSQYKGELTQLEKITFRVVELHGKNNFPRYIIIPPKT
ncbi:hypothetical protein MKR66_15995 [Acinetobacter baumannii]